MRKNINLTTEKELTQRRQDAKMDENEIGKIVVDACVRMHRELGPGLLESVYEVVLAKELEERGLRVKRQVPVPIVYRGLRFDEGVPRGHHRGRPGDSRNQVGGANHEGSCEAGVHVFEIKGTEIGISAELRGKPHERWNRAYRQRSAGGINPWRETQKPDGKGTHAKTRRREE